MKKLLALVSMITCIFGVTGLEAEAASISSAVDNVLGMDKTTLNTIIGLSVIAVVLILLVIIFSSFRLIFKMHKIYENSTGKAGSNGIDNAISRIAQQEEAGNLVNDTELVAVIAAAIAAYEGSTSTNGFVVRSIRKARR